MDALLRSPAPAKPTAAVGCIIAIWRFSSGLAIKITEKLSGLSMLFMIRTQEERVRYLVRRELAWLSRLNV